MTPSTSDGPVKALANGLNWISDRLFPGHASQHALVGALFVAGLGLLAVCPVVGEYFEDLSYDTATVVTAAAQSPANIAMVYVDRDSVSQPAIGDPPNRGEYARLLRLLQANGASRVAFDVLMDTPRPGDRELAESLRAFGKAYLGAMHEGSGTGGSGLMNVVGTQFHEPIPLLATNAAGVGMAQVDSRDSSRFHPRRRLVDTVTVAGTTRRPLGAEAAGTGSDPGTSSRWLRYYGGVEPFGHASLAAVLETPTDKDKPFGRGATVFVGARPDYRPDDAWGTPFTRFGGRSATMSPGVDIHATTYSNLVQRDWITSVPAGLVVALLAVFGAALVLLFAVCGRALCLVVGLGAAVVVFLASLMLFAHSPGGLTWPWALPVMVQVPVAFAWRRMGNHRTISCRALLWFILRRNVALISYRRDPVGKVPSDLVWLAERLGALGWRVDWDKREGVPAGDFMVGLKEKILRAPVFIPLVNTATFSRYPAGPISPPSMDDIVVEEYRFAVKSERTVIPVMTMTGFGMKARFPDIFEQDPHSVRFLGMSDDDGILELDRLFREV